LIRFSKDTLIHYLDQLDCSIEAFYSELSKAQSFCEDDFYIQVRMSTFISFFLFSVLSCHSLPQVFIECLLASTEYSSFYNVMVRTAQKLKIKQADEAKADSKASTGSELDSKLSKSPNDASMRADAKPLSPKAPIESKPPGRSNLK
jgi:hypothetical protein